MNTLAILAQIWLLQQGSFCSRWKETLSDEEDSDLHRFAIEHGLWTPDPSDLVGLHEYPETVGGALPEGSDFAVPKTEAYFITPNNTFVTVQVGNPATLRCQLDKVAASETVSWVRRRDHHLITLGPATYTSDGRFHLTHTEENNGWTLNLKFAQLRDAGVYECQLSTHPPMGILTSLTVIQPIAVIKGSPDLYAQVGSHVTLTCRLKNFTIPPTYVFWYHEEQMINYDTDRKINVISQGGESVLRLARLEKEDSGNYTCVPANAKAATITLHVIPGELPAAMQGAAPSTCHGFTTFAALMLFCIAFSL